MAYSYVEYNGDGVTTTFTLTFPYILQSHVAVYVGGVLKALTTDYTFPTASSIQFVAAPANGVLIHIERASSRSTRLVNFQNGSTLTEADLDKDGDQVFYVAQESIDTAKGGIYLDTDGKLTASNKVIKNVANPVSAQDVATKSYGDTNWGAVAAASASASATSAASSATSAANSATSATASAASIAGKKVGRNKPLYNNKLIVFCGDSTTEKGQVSERGGLYDRLLNYHSVSGGVLEGVKGVVNYGMSAYTLASFVNDAANPSFVGASASNPNWDYTGVKTWGVWGGVSLNDAIKTAGDVYVICYGINDLILSNTGAGTQGECQAYIVNLLSQAVERLSAALPDAQIVLRPPSPMTSRPYSQTAYPSQAVYPTFGVDGAVDSALVMKWNAALYWAYYQVAQTYRNTDFLDVWNMVAYNFEPAVVPADKNPYAWDLVHPNNAGYTAIADGLAMLFSGKTSGYSQPRATQAEGMVQYFTDPPVYYYGRYPEGPYYNKLFENAGTVTTTYIDIAIPLASFQILMANRTAFTFCLDGNQFKSRTVSFLTANLSDPTGLGVTTRIGGLTINASATGSGIIGIYEDKRAPAIISPSLTMTSGTLSIVVTGGTGSSTFTLPSQGTYLVTLNARTDDYNHGRLGTYLVTFDNATVNDWMSTQLVGVQITKGTNLPTSLTCTVDQAGVLTVTINAGNFTWPVDYSYSQIAKK